jgi:hypothetical protein
MDLFGSLANSWLYIFNILRRQSHSNLETLDRDNTHAKIYIYITMNRLQLTENMKTKTQTNFNPQKYVNIENKRWFIV